MEAIYDLKPETKNVFNYIKTTLVDEYPPHGKISIDYMILSILLNEDCIAYKILSKIMLSENILLMISDYRLLLFNQSSVDLNNNNRNLLFEDRFDNLFKKAKDEFNTINTAILFMAYFSENNKQLSQYGITMEQFRITFYSYDTDTSNKASNNNLKTSLKTNNKVKTIKLTNTSELDKNMTNISKLASEGKLDKFIGGNNYYEKIFTAFGKCQKNNILIVGEPGVGKTCFVKNIANLLMEGEVPEIFKNKQLFQLDFDNLVVNTGFKGMFESKFHNLVEEMKRNGECIVFIDDIHTILSDYNRYAETSTEKLLQEILNEKNILVIATTNFKSYKTYIGNKPLLKRRFQKIVIETPSKEDVIDILHYYSEKFSRFHNVYFNDEIINKTYNLCKRYLSEYEMPDIAIDILDEIGSFKEVNATQDNYIQSLLNQLDCIIEEKNKLVKQNLTDLYSEIDRLTRDEIAIKSAINKREKELNMNKSLVEVSLDDVKHVISQRANLSLKDITINEKDNLKQLENNLLNKVIGQDEAVKTVAKVVQKQRLSISNPNKPSVLFFAGSTGTGKTHLAKTLAKEVFGSEKYLVRLDMSEYSDKMSTNKLYGSAAGYVGYDNGGILTEAIKKKKNCVLLLDEIEKANEEVHNVFLQLFDEGRLTDNTGEVVDFKNVIIIMTSNIGVKESIERGKQIGFNKNTDFTKTIIEKELKKKFKPEFLNRIDKLIFFNKLNNENLLQIIKNEIKIFNERIEEIGYKLDDTITETCLPQKILDNISSHSEYGARPILREIQKELEDKITDYILNNNIEEGFTFSYEKLNN